jgi:class 3 adenylate cyclase
MSMVGNAAWSRLGTPRIGGLFATRHRRWMQGHPTPTFVFVDLAGYTALTETRGDQAAARVASEFQRTMSVLSRQHGAWQIKAMGDRNEALVSATSLAAASGDLPRQLGRRRLLALRGVERPVVAWCLT